jgi:hypothetical protein
MKFVMSLYQQSLVISLVYVLAKDGIFMQKHVGVMSVLLYVYDTVHLVGCNKRIY